ncbi:delta-1-pyrroline-5-carboxylate dehydrogenase, mitochondrial [Myiozetetes cayanensis]|uniref:delta-1-pyrroline-5-carboxylate dehydrogenase, mitochondrial n=1 Tax=Myiozetetes cayanensis TaxID=478635 RepID=UPI00215E71EC|nr:delta-1-pyrroline-5-carboxylate dehydrogenase, mitochondrial [Myiozetetes cayanensis]
MWYPGINRAGIRGLCQNQPHEPSRLCWPALHTLLQISIPAPSLRPGSSLSARPPTGSSVRRRGGNLSMKRVPVAGEHPIPAPRGGHRRQPHSQPGADVGPLCQNPFTRPFPNSLCNEWFCPHPAAPPRRLVAASGQRGGAGMWRGLRALRGCGRRCQHHSAIQVTNEPILEFKPGSPERAALQKALADLKGKTEDIPCVIGGEEVWTPTVRYQLSPFNHAHKVAKFCYASKELINKAINAALAVRKEWDLKPVQDRAQIFLKAADMLSGPRRAEVLAKTMIGQGKTVIQAEIDAAAELIDFFRFNAKYALELEQSQPLSVDVSTNSMVYRGLEGFVAAVSPFNFTAIGGNLAGAPALMGNVVLWKPSDTALLSSYAVYKILLEAGLPPNVVQFVPADGPVFGDTVTSSEHFCGLNFTGSVPTFKRLWKQVSENLDRYRNFPRLAGECGGKNFHVVHSSADVGSVVNGTLRSAFEYGGQKCSACSRLYAPDSLWPQIKEKLLEEHGKIKVGDPAQDFGTFFSAVIDDKSFARIKKWLEHAKKSSNLTILAGGGCDDSVGYFVEPCIVESKDPQDPIMKEEIFGPILTVFVYPEKRYKEVLELIDTTTPYGLTGALFAQEKRIIEESRSVLRNAAGNFYINDKSTGAVVAQQPFGGSRISGTNDKPGGPHYLLRWTSPQAIKETHVPLRDWRYSYMQ